MRKITKNLPFSCLILGFIFSIVTPPAFAVTPGETVVQSIEKGLAILTSPELQGEEYTEERQRLLWNELSPMFTFEEGSKRALGRHWLRLSATDKDRFTAAFQNLLRNIYLNKSNLYQGGTIEFVREVVKGKKSKVKTHFIKYNRQLEINFNMILENNIWKVYDVAIEGVSVLSNYRSQFNSLLSKSSFEELLPKIGRKIIGDLYVT